MVKRSTHRATVSEREFESFVATSGDQLMRTAYLLTCDLRSAEDLYQETLRRLLKRWAAVDEPKAFCWCVMHNLATDHGRARARRPREAPLQALAERGDPRSADRFGAVELRPDLVRALSALSVHQRAVVVLRYFGDMSEAEIAETLDVAPGTVKSTASRAMQLLRCDPALASLLARTADRDEGSGLRRERDLSKSH